MFLLCNLTPLLVFLATIDVGFGTITCYDTTYGLGYYDHQLPLYEHMHRWLNLTLTCEAVYAAVDAAERHRDGQKDTVMTEYWCKYSRGTWSKRNYKEYWLANTVLREMDWNLAVHTALLHPHTTYGCGAVDYSGSYYYYYQLVCIYKKTSDNPCYIEWTYP